MNEHQANAGSGIADWTTLVDLGVLRGWLDEQAIGAGPLEQVRPLSGGTQNILVGFERAGRRYVLRRPPAHPQHDGNATMRREARALTALADTQVPHPRIIAACPDVAVLGAAFYVMEAVDGFNPTQGLPALHATDPAMRRRMGLALVEGISQLGCIDVFAKGLDDLGRIDGYLERQTPRWRKQLAGYSVYEGWPGASALPGIDLVSDWLELHRPEHFEPGLVHGDYHLSNVMFRNESAELAAIVDWELVSVGDPLVDLGWVVATWPDPSGPVPQTVGAQPWDGFPTAPELVEHYGRGSRRDLSRIRWYAVLGCFRLGIIIEGTHARACAGKADAVIGDRLHSQAVFLFERAMKLIASDRPLSTVD